MDNKRIIKRYEVDIEMILKQIVVHQYEAYGERVSVRVLILTVLMFPYLIIHRFSYEWGRQQTTAPKGTNPRSAAV